MQVIPQVFCELDRLGHVSVEYSSTLFSYRTMTDILSLLKENILKEIRNREEEVKLFQTQQGIGLRQIMFQHYHRVYQLISHEHNIFTQVTQSINEKHKAMQNSINFIGPIMKEIQHKAKVLDQQLIQINHKITKLTETKLFHKKSVLNQENNPSQSEIFQCLAKTLEKQNNFSQYQCQNQQSFSLFSPRKFQLLQTETQFSQVQSFLDLKLMEVQEFIKIERELTQRTVNKIFQIFDETMGKGLQKLEKSILDFLPSQSVHNSQNVIHDIQIPKLQFKDNDNVVPSESSDSLDLSCYENLQDIMKQPIDLRFVRKRLYDSSQTQNINQICSNESKKSSENENESEVLGVSPTFKFTCPLIIDSVEDISQFKVYQASSNKEGTSSKQLSPQNQQYFLYDSFCKQNINTLNI